MFSFNFIKLCGFCLLLVLSFSACRWWRGGGGEGENAAPVPPPFAAEELKSEIPFVAAEPEVFRAEIVIAANDAERRIFIARRGAERRWDYDFGASRQITKLQTDKNYLIFPAKKIYAEETAESAAAAADDRTDFLTARWLNAKTAATFERLKSENNLTKYAVRLDGKNFSEIVVTVDESARLPVRQEFYSVTGDQRTLTFTVELRNFETSAAADLFVVPHGYKKVSSESWRKEINKNE